MIIAFIPCLSIEKWHTRWLTEPIKIILDPCPSWLIKASRDGTAGWAKEVIDASLRGGVVPGHLKEAVVRPLLKRSCLDPENLSNYRPVANVPFLGKVLERVVAGQLQTFLEETDFLDPFQSGFRPGFGTETALVALYDDLCRERDRGSVTCWFSLISQRLSIPSTMVSFWSDWLRWEWEVLRLQWFRSYLAGRLQKVGLGEHCSAPWILQYGVPQGSVLSPMLL